MVKIFLHTTDGIIGKRFNHLSALGAVADFCKFIGSQAFKKPKRPALFSFSGNFSCSQNTRKIRFLHIFFILKFRAVMRPTTNAPGIEQVFGSQIPITKHQWETQDIFPFNKKWSFFLKKCFE